MRARQVLQAVAHRHSDGEEETGPGCSRDSDRNREDAVPDAEDSRSNRDRDATSGKVAANHQCPESPAATPILGDSDPARIEMHDPAEFAFHQAASPALGDEVEQAGPDQCAPGEAEPRHDQKEITMSEQVARVHHEDVAGNGEWYARLFDGQECASSKRAELLQPAAK